MTLNGIIAAFIVRYFTKFGTFGADYIQVVEDRLIMSAKNCSSENLVFITTYGDIRKIIENECINNRHLRDSEYIQFGAQQIND